jgi:tetratricopeptide (TPR) repeat protein
MNDRNFLSVFTPSRTPPEDLEAIFVQRQLMLADAVERVRESVTTGNKHHLLFVGPRGTGKTHLVTLLVHRLSLDMDIQDRLAIAWLNEDETSTTLLEFLRRIYLALNKRYPDSYSLVALEPIYDLDSDTAERRLGNLLLEHLQDRTLLVVVENLDALFEGLGEPGQQRLRAFIQENPVLCIVATAQRLVDDISKRKSVFFGFFQTESLVTLSVDEAAEMLGKIAILRKQADAAAFLSTPTGRSRIQALHHLSGGNHRIYIVLSQFITRDSIDALVGPFAKMIDEMTPYYQERIRWLPAQQRKIVEYLCTCERPVPVKDLARRLFATPQTISSQLKDLREKGYVLSAQRGRESLYEMAEPLMRLCVEVKENQTREPMRLLVDFLRVWYDDSGLFARLQKSEKGSLDHAYLQAAMDKNAKFGNLRKQLLVDGFRAELREEQHKQWMPLIESAVEDSEELAYAIGENAKGHIEEAIAAYSAVIQMPDAPVNVVARAFLNRGVAYGQQGDSEKEIADYTAVIKLPNVTVELIAKALINRGITYGELGDYENEIADYTAVINLPNAPVGQIVDAFFYRGFSYGQMGDSEKQIADYTAVINLPNVPVEEIARALNNRGITYGQLGDSEKEIADYTAVIDLPNASNEQIAKALNNQGTTYGQLGDYEHAIADYTAVIDLPNVPVEQIIDAFYNRGFSYGQLGDHEKAVTDYTAIINFPDAPAEQIANALNGRSWVYSEISELEKAIADYTSFIELPNMPMEKIILAHYSRGVELLNHGEIDKSIEDFNTVINSPNTPAEYLARTLSFRGSAYLRLNQLNNSEQDFEATLRLVADIPIEFRVAFHVGAHIALAEIRIATGLWDYALSTLAEGLKQGTTYDPPYFGDSTDILKAFFDSGLAPAIRRERARQLAQIYQDYNAVPHLGEALTRHVGSLYRNLENLPASDNLEQWACAWEEAGKDMPAFRLPLRIFRTGIDFLKTGGKDRGVLLDLKQEERRILQQALGLDAADSS